MNNLRDEKDMTPIVEYVTWQDVETFIQFVADNTHNFKDFNGVYGPARGGLVYAVIISNRYNIPFLGAPQKGCIVVDDICDTGDTARAWLNKGYYIATHYYKEGCKIIPNLHYKVKTDKWIKFPFE